MIFRLVLNFFSTNFGGKTWELVIDKCWYYTTFYGIRTVKGFGGLFENVPMERCGAVVKQDCDVP